MLHTSVSLIVLVISSHLCDAASTSQLGEVSFPSGANLLTRARDKRSSRIINECYLVGLEEGTYYYKSKGTEDVCAVYLAADADQRVEVTFDYINVDCDSMGIISYVDGWEMRGDIFPGLDDLPMEDRAQEFCGKLKKKTLISSSNAAAILYRIPQRANGFKVTIRFRRHPNPCHILVSGTSGLFTLRNHGTASNCTLASIYPAKISIVQLSAGVYGGHRGKNAAYETGVIYGCTKRGLKDYVLIGGSMSLDPAFMTTENALCGMDSNPRVKPSVVLCEVSLVRLVSSGTMENTITVAVDHLADDLNVVPTTICDLPM